MSLIIGQQHDENAMLLLSKMKKLLWQQGSSVQRLLVFSPEVLFGNTGINEIPGQML